MKLLSDYMDILIKNTDLDSIKKLYRPKDIRPNIFLNSQPQQTKIRNSHSRFLEIPKNFYYDQIFSYSEFWVLTLLSMAAAGFYVFGMKRVYLIH